MAAMNRIRPASRECAVPDAAPLSAALGDALNSFGNSLPDSVVGVAFYDRRLCCLALNQQFAALCSVPQESLRDKPLRRAFGAQGKRLKSSLQSALAAGNVVPNLSVVPVRQDSAAAPLLLTLYPLRDAHGLVFLLATTLCRSPLPANAERHLACFVAKLQEGFSPEPLHGRAVLPEVLASALQSASGALRTLKESLSSASPLSDSQLETGLLPLLLFLTLATPQPNVSLAASPTAQVPAAPESAAPSAFAETPSPRELQVLHHLATGQSNKEIGRALGISTRTVESYRARIVRKLSLHSTAELVRYAIRHKIIEL